MADPMIEERVQMLTPEYREFVLSDYAEKTARIFGEPLGFDEEEIIAFENGIALFLLFFFSKDDLIQFLSEESDIPLGTAITVVDTICDGLPEGMVANMQETFELLNPERTQQLQQRRPVPETEEQPQFIPTSVTYGPLGEPQQQQAHSGAAAQPEAAAAPGGQQSEEGDAGAVQPLRTMEDDMDRIHGYGAYRKMFPDAKQKEGESGQQTQRAQQQISESAEQVHQATPQDEVLGKRPPLAGTPSYDKPPEQ